MKTCIKNLFLVPMVAASLGLIPPGRLTAQTFTNLHSFAGSDGTTPYATLTVSGNTLYGTTKDGGLGSGTVFRINTDGTAFTNIHNFTATSGPLSTNDDGANPYAGLVLSGNTLYGTAPYGGSDGKGTIFKVNTDGSGYTNVYNFTYGNDGANPNSGLVLFGNALYGTVGFGGSTDQGDVFKVNTDGSGFTNLHSFTGGFNEAYSDAGLFLS